MTNEYFRLELASHSEVMQSLLSIEKDIEAAIGEVTHCMRQGRTLFLCGNGGSAADSQHIAAEFVGRFKDERPPLPAVALTTDTSAITCIANDYDFSKVFSRQLQGLGSSGDVLLAISTSGSSPNVIEAAKVAKEMGIRVIALSGRGGGKLAEICDVSIVVESDETARIQECHIFIGHTICGAVELALNIDQR